MSRVSFLVLAVLIGGAPVFAQVVKPPIHGLVSMGSLSFNGVPGALPTNRMEEINAHPGIYSAAVIALLWSQLEPQQGVFDDSALLSALAAIDAYNAQYPATPVAAKLRIFAGDGTPAWVMQLTGGPITVTNNNGTIQIGAFWTTAYRAAWQGLQAHLASEYDATSTIAEVAISSCASITAEPFILSLDAVSLANMRQFGYSDAAAMACLLGAANDYASWANTPLDFTFNQFRNSDGCITAGQTGCLVGNPAFTMQVVQQFRAAIGAARGVVANHGLQNPPAAAAQPVYAEMQSLYSQQQAQIPPTPSPLEFQTYGPTVDWDSTIEFGLTFHPTEIEIWDTVAAGGPANVDTAQLQNYAAQVQADDTPIASPLVVSAATLQVGAVASGSLVTLFGSALTSSAGSSTLTITDSSGTAQQAAVVFASPTQINAVLPDGLAPGVAAFSVAPGGGSAVTGSFLVASVAPGLFAINASGTGVAAAQTITQHADGSVSNGSAFSCPATGPCTPAPIDVSTSGDTVYLILFGTGFRNRSALNATSVSLGDTSVTPVYAGAQNQFAGLDQINVVIPASLAGAGLIDVSITADGVSSIAVTVQIQ